MALPALPTIPSLPTPSILKKNVGIVLYYKDKTGFITGATVTFEKWIKWLISSYYATSIGILYYASIPTGMGVKIYAQKAGIDFGEGVGVKAIVGGDTGFDSVIHEFVANTPFPCPNITPTIGATLFDSPLPTAVPAVFVPPMSGYSSGVGNVSITEGTFEISLDNIVINSGGVPSSGKIDKNLPPIKDIPSLIGKTSATIKVVIKWYHCTFTGTKTVSLPPLPPICTPPQVYNPITGRCETPIPVCTPPQVYNPVTGRCETPVPTICPDAKTTVESVNHDSVLPSTPSTPFFISINKIKLECPPALTKKMTGEIGTVTLGSLSAQFPIPSPGQSDGEVYFDLSKLIDLSKIIGGAPVIPTPPPKPTKIGQSFEITEGNTNNFQAKMSYDGIYRGTYTYYNITKFLDSAVKYSIDVWTTNPLIKAWDSRIRME